MDLCKSSVSGVKNISGLQLSTEPKSSSQVKQSAPIAVRNKQKKPQTNGTCELKKLEIEKDYNITGLSYTAQCNNVVMSEAAPSGYVEESNGFPIQTEPGQNTPSSAIWPNKAVWQYMTLPFTITSSFQNQEQNVQTWKNSGPPRKLTKYFEAKWQKEQSKDYWKNISLASAPSKEEILHSKEMWPYIKDMYSKKESKHPKRLGEPKKKSVNALRTSNKLGSSKLGKLSKKKVNSSVTHKHTIKIDTYKQNALKLIFKKPIGKADHSTDSHHEKRTKNSKATKFSDKPAFSKEELLGKGVAIPVPDTTTSILEEISLYGDESTPGVDDKPIKNLYKGIPDSKASRIRLDNSAPIILKEQEQFVTLDEPLDLTTKSRYKEPEHSKRTIADNKDARIKRRPVSPVKTTKKRKLSPETQIYKDLSQSDQRFCPKMRFVKKKTIGNREVWTTNKTEWGKEKNNKAQQYKHARAEPLNHNRYPRILLTKEKTANNQEVWTIREKMEPAEKKLKPVTSSLGQQSKKVQGTSRTIGAAKIKISKQKTVANKEVWTIKHSDFNTEKQHKSLKVSDSSDMQGDGISEPIKEFWIKKDKLNSIEETEKLTVDVVTKSSEVNTKTAGTNFLNEMSASTEKKWNNQSNRLNNNTTNGSVITKVPRQETHSEEVNSAGNSSVIKEVPRQNTGLVDLPNVCTLPREHTDMLSLTENRSVLKEVLKQNTELLNLAKICTVLKRKYFEENFNLRECQLSQESSCKDTTDVNGEPEPIQNCTPIIDQDVANLLLLEMVAHTPDLFEQNNPYEVADLSIMTSGGTSGVTHLPCAYQEKFLRSISLLRIRKALKLHQTLINQLGGFEAIPERKPELKAFNRELTLELLRRQFKIKDDEIPHLRLAIMKCIETDLIEKNEETSENVE